MIALGQRFAALCPDRRLRLACLTVALLLFASGVAWLLQPSSAQAEARELGIRLRAGSTDLPIRSDSLVPGIWTDERILTLWWEPANNRPIKFRLRTDELEESAAGMIDLVQVRLRDPQSTAYAPSLWQGALRNLQFVGWNRNTPGSPPSWPQVYSVSFKLSESAGNDYQGQRIDFDLLVDATQDANPGW